MYTMGTMSVTASSSNETSETSPKSTSVERTRRLIRHVTEYDRLTYLFISTSPWETTRTTNSFNHHLRARRAARPPRVLSIMSRMSTAQVIAIGEYLHPDFDPATLTVPQLLGVFGFHQIPYPSQYTKAKLVQLFKDEIQPQAKKFTKERLKRENSQASDDGIKDGVTGKLINEKPIRRSTRRTSRAPSHDDVREPEPAPVAPPKRRRSSAEPSIGGPSRRKTIKPIEPPVAEESEPEEEVLVRKVGRSKKSSADAATQARRVSQAIAEEHDSGWEDNNIFQSGAESSSPARPSPARVRTRRTSVAPRLPVKSRKSMSAPPEYASSPSPPKAKGKGRASVSTVKPPESSFEPRLPPGVVRENKAAVAKAEKSTFLSEVFTPVTPRRVSIVRDDLKEQEEEHNQMQALAAAIATSGGEVRAQLLEEVEEEDEEEIEGEGEEENDEFGVDDDQVDAVSQRISEGGRLAKHQPQGLPASTSWSRRVLTAIIVVLGSWILHEFQQESKPIGFCDAGRSTNAVLEDLRAHRVAVESCNRENRTMLYLSSDPGSTESVLSPVSTASAVDWESGHAVDVGASTIEAERCPALPLPLLPQPDACTPCPLYATCTPSTITCDVGYILRPHPFLFFVPVPGSSGSSSSPQVYNRTSHFFSTSDLPQLIYAAVSTLDGFPGIGPVVLPPHCAEDPRRKRHIGQLGKAVEAHLAAERGRRLCEGVGVGLPEGDEATEAKRWGLELDKLKEDFRKKTAPGLLDTLDDTFNEAVQQLVQWGGVIMGEDADGKRYLAHRTPVMDWTCTLRVKARDAWSEWQRSIIGTMFAVAAILYIRRRQAQKAIENRRVAHLVTVALELLRNQEILHYTDPVAEPAPYLSSLQLRDLVLQDEHNVRARSKLWNRVERVVEGNANVRTNLEEVRGGDELRVWRWVAVRENH
ncbi:Inner nuclear membrane protein SRC1 [Grifola frondosa]|uniref:Inner nuclear membrane protein SRC1 n=1 Tax=Grifola frondosa TaxID=5627 RepID=A0A1C7MEJ4_GRIFR|nr:Inner nuclear membrane protein SRC1 [Grifola frondosa]